MPESRRGGGGLLGSLTLWGIGMKIKHVAVAVALAALALVGIILWATAGLGAGGPPTPPATLVDSGTANTQGAVANEPSSRTLVAVPGAPAPETAALAGKVLVTLGWEGEGGPVAGHEVVAIARWHPGQLAAHARARSDAQGRAELELPPGRHVVMALVDMGAAVDVVAGATSAVRFDLPRAGVLLGRVVDERDQPIGGAEVLALRGELPGREGSVIAVSDAEGSFRAQLGTSMSFVQARKPGHGASAAMHVYGFPGTQERVELVLAAVTTRLRGRVVAVDGQPVAGARVVLGAPTPPPRGNPYVEPGQRDEARAAADGSFEFTDVPPGTGAVMAIAPGFLFASAPFTAAVDVLAECQVTLLRAPRIEGRVVDHEGRPVAGARLGGKYWHPRDQLTAADGTFARDGRFGSNELYAWHAQLGAARAEFELSDREVRTVELRLDDEPRLAGRLLDEAGAPVSGMWVGIWPEVVTAEHPAPATLTDQDGRFEFVACQPGSHKLTVRRQRIYNGPPWLTAQVVPGRRDAPPVELVLRAASRPSAYLSLQVTDPSDPERPVQVVVEHFESGHAEYSLLACGAPTRLGPLVPGTYRVRHHFVHRADPPVLGLDLGPLALAAGEVRDLGAHVLAPGNRLDLTLRCGDAPPPRHASLRLHPESGGAAIECGRDERGKFWPRSLPPGRYRLEVVAGFTHTGASATVEVLPGRSVAVTVDLAPLQSCEFELAWPTDRPRPYRVAGTLRSGATTRPITFYNCIVQIGLPPGRHRIEATPMELGGGTLAIDIDIERVAAPVLRQTLR